MSPLLTWVTRQQITIFLIVALLASAGTAAAVNILTKNPNPVSAAEGTLSSSPVTIDSQSLTYSGTNATGVDIVVNNTDTGSHTIDIHIALRKADGTVVESTTKTGTSVSAGSTKSVTWTFSTEHPVDTFSDVEVTVEQTG